MLRDGQRKVPEIWPKSGLPQDGPKVVRVKAAGSDESDSEDRAPIPQYQDSFGNAIQQALDNYTTQTGPKILDCCQNSYKNDRFNFTFRRVPQVLLDLGINT